MDIQAQEVFPLPTTVRIWEVTAGGSLNAIPNTQITLEEQLDGLIEILHSLFVLKQAAA